MVRGRICILKNLDLAIKLWVDTRAKNMGFEITEENLVNLETETPFGKRKETKTLQQIHLIFLGGNENLKKGTNEKPHYANYFCRQKNIRSKRQSINVNIHAAGISQK